LPDGPQEKCNADYKNERGNIPQQYEKQICGFSINHKNEDGRQRVAEQVDHGGVVHKQRGEKTSAGLFKVVVRRLHCENGCKSREKDGQGRIIKRGVIHI
jgi:hypothetical protein